MNSKTVEEIIIQYIIYMRNSDFSSSYINNRLAAITAFLSLNDVSINRKKLNRFVGEQRKTVKDEAYNHEDLKKMFQFATFRTRLLIAIYSSTGIRKGAIIDLKLKHLQKIESHELYKFTIYENTKDEYITFCTPECASMIDEYIKQRKTAGENITQESYLIRNDYNFVLSKNARKPKKTSISALKIVMDALLYKSELRQVNHSTENNKYKRHSKSMFHAFRKYFNTCLVNVDINLTIKEMLMGHSVGMDDSYFRPTEQKLQLEYSKAINELTINEENRLKKKVNELQEKQGRIDRLVNRIDGLEKQLGIGII
ncbi:MAG: tyrosine-type recombinase/integrase [Nitrososphaeraceae archaeon]